LSGYLRWERPGNILVGEDGAPKLVDFGIAKVLDPLSGPAGSFFIEPTKRGCAANPPVK